MLEYSLHQVGHGHGDSRVFWGSHEAGEAAQPKSEFQTRCG